MSNDNVKIRIEAQEWWPVYVVTDDEFASEEFEVPRALIEDVKRTAEAFRCAQDRIRAIRNSNNSCRERDRPLSRDMLDNLEVLERITLPSADAPPGQGRRPDCPPG